MDLIFVFLIHQITLKHIVILILKLLIADFMLLFHGVLLDKSIQIVILH